MKISYDTKYDVLYIKFRDGQVQVTTRHLTDEFAIDVDKAGHLVGLEILSASTHLDLNELLPIEVAKG